MIGTVTMPVAIVGVVLMQLLRTDVHPLVPALQSTWLHVHVTLAMLAYAACALSFALAMMFLIQDKLKTETFLAATSLFSLGTYVGDTDALRKMGRAQRGRVEPGREVGSLYVERRASVRGHSRSGLADASGTRRCGCAARSLSVWRKNPE